MARTYKGRPDVYFGRPGALIRLPWPRGDMDRSYDRLTFDFQTGSGQHMVSSMSSGSRSYTLTWNALHVDNYRYLEQYWTGNMGVGPWVFIDPSMQNMLMPNQASTTTQFNDVRGWTTTSTANGTPSSNVDVTRVHRPGALRSLRWLFTVAAATNPELRMIAPYRSWFGYPVVPNLSYVWSAWARPDGIVDSAITLAIRLRWYDISGALITEITGGDVAMTGWTQLSVIGVAPSNAAYCQPVFVALGSTITIGASIYIDEANLEQDTVLNGWAPGTGLRPVEILGLPDHVPFDSRFRTSLAMNLRELAQ